MTTDHAFDHMAGRPTGVPALHHELERIRQNIAAAVTRWVVGEMIPPSVQSLTQRTLEYRAVDDIFDGFGELVTDISDQIKHDDGDSMTSCIDDLWRALSTQSPGSVPIGDVLTFIAFAIGQYRDGVAALISKQVDRPSLDIGHQLGEQSARVNLLIEGILASETRRDIARYRDDIQQVAREVGDTAARQLSADFKSLADYERRSADRFRIVTLGCLAIALAIGVSIFFLDSRFDLQRQILKLAAEVPLFLAAYYFSSESRDHRKNATRAREIEVRLNTIRAYTDDMDASDRNAIRVSMGKAIFRDPILLGKYESVTDAGSAMANQIADILRARADGAE